MDETSGAQTDPPTQDASREPHLMRITDHGKINLFVSFALKFLQENPQRPLVFHTYPPLRPKVFPESREDLQSIAKLQPCVRTSLNETAITVKPPQKRRKLATSTANTPRLITVVEIVKREYGKWAATRKTADGNFVEDSMRAGLHQYNELSCLEDLGIIDRHDIPDVDQLHMVLEGKNFLKQKPTAHLKVTLSVFALPILEEQGATYQPPAPPAKISKSAKARQRKRQTKKKMAE